MTDVWYYATGEQRIGPLSFAKLHEAIASLDLDDVIVWGGGAADWKPARDVPELSGLNRAVPPPLPTRGVGQPAEATQILAFDADGETQAAPRRASRLRTTDWIRGIKLLIQIPFGGATCALIAYFILAWGSQGNPGQEGRASAISLAIAFAGILFGPLALIVHLMGHVFDPARDRLTYPTYIFRRSIPISGITDANCETLIGHTLADASEAFSPSYGGSKLKRPRPLRVYAVDVSGDFGVRQVRFGAKYKRNQFLSHLRAAAPQCQITRWL